jgi:hypothetical protein
MQRPSTRTVGSDVAGLERDNRLGVRVYNGVVEARVGISKVGRVEGNPHGTLGHSPAKPVLQGGKVDRVIPQNGRLVKSL